MMSPCELQRVSLSARHITRPCGTIPIVKPMPVEEKIEEPAKEKVCFVNSSGSSAVVIYMRIIVDLAPASITPKGCAYYS